MDTKPRDPEQILSRISGFHQYRLEHPAAPVYVSRNLCDMLGLPEEALLCDGQDRYALQVHPADREAYEAFLRSFGGSAQTMTARYRLIRHDGGILHVSDTMTAYRLDGVLMGDSVLTDITDLKRENENLQFLNETMPCGFLKYTCEKTPRITWLNERMKQLLGLSDADADELELYTQNVYMMIPVEDRRRFAAYLDRVSRSGAPLAGEMTVLRCDGTRLHLFGWVTKCVNEQGLEEFQSACMDITERHHVRREQEARRYLNALTEVYDRIFEFDLSSRTVKCLHGPQLAQLRWIENIPMQLEEATEKWIVAGAVEEDRERVRSFFREQSRKRSGDTDAPPVIHYRDLDPDGKPRSCSGLFVKIDASSSLFCCRELADVEESLRSENASLKQMQELVLRFSDGIAAFEIVEDVVTPLYASDNVCQFFGFSKEEWLSVMKKRTPIREFVARSRASYGAFQELLEQGEAEFTYFDLSGQQERRIRAVCSRKTPGGAGPRYVMLYSADGERGRQERCRVRIRTFGYFDVFVDGKPIAFRNEKSRELLALLVDRRGGFISSEEAIGFLWEDESANPVTLARYRKVALRLKNTLEEYGIPDIVESVNGKRRIVAEKVRCDLYDYLSGVQEYAQLFKGSYLTNYSWSETTLAELTGERLYVLEE